MRERMALAAESLDFERAAQLRDVLSHLEQMEEPTVVMEVEGGDRDVIGYARDGDDAVIALLRIRAGKLLARDHQFVENVDERAGRRRARDVSRRPVSAARGARARAAAPVRRRGPRASSRSRSSARRSMCRSAVRGASSIELAQQNARHLLEEAAAHGRRDRGARRRSRLRAAAAARTAEGAALASSASTSRTRRARTPSRRASGSRTAGRIAPSIASSR